MACRKENVIVRWGSREAAVDRKIGLFVLSTPPVSSELAAYAAAAGLRLPRENHAGVFFDGVRIERNAETGSVGNGKGDPVRYSTKSVLRLAKASCRSAAKPSAAFQPCGMKEATEQFRLALKVDPRYMNARFNLAGALARAGDRRGALVLGNAQPPSKNTLPGDRSRPICQIGAGNLPAHTILHHCWCGAATRTIASE